jgi:hypothetical protein
MPWSRSSVSNGAKLDKRNFSKPSGGAMRECSSSWTGRTPMRMRKKSLVPRWSMTDCTPLCPPAPLLNEHLMSPSEICMSSYTTVTTASGYCLNNALAASPELFIKVSGFANNNSAPNNATAAENNFLSSNFRASCAAIASSAIHPMLCRWPAWALPGLPSPITIFMLLLYHIFCVCYTCPNYGTNTNNKPASTEQSATKAILSNWPWKIY